MTDTFEEVAAVETPAIAEIVPPVEVPVEQTEEQKQVERTFTQKEHEQAIQAAKAKMERKYERELVQRLERENESLRQRNEPKAVEAPGKPARESFPDDISYVESLAQWTSDQRFEKLMKEQAAKSYQTAQAREFNQTVSSHEKRAEALRASNPEYDEIVNSPDLNISEAMAKTIVQSDAGPKIALYLGKNPSEADRIAALPPHLAVYELGKLEAKISAVQPKTLSNAPAPIKPVISGRALTKDLESMSQEEFEKHLKKNGSRMVR